MKNIKFPLLIAAFLLSCNKYYKAITVTNPAETEFIKTVNIKDKYFIIHNGNNAFAMENILLSNDNNLIKYQLSELPKKHTIHLNRTNPKKFKYNPGNSENDEVAVLNEIHFYTDSSSVLTKGSTELAVNKVNKIEIIVKDKQKTTTKQILTWGISLVAIAATTFVIVGTSAYSW